MNLTWTLKSEMLGELYLPLAMKNLATSFKDLDNIIKDGENGYLLKTQDVETWRQR